MLMALLPVTGALATHVTPVFVSGNADCAAATGLQPWTAELGGIGTDGKISNPTTGTYGPISIVVNDTAQGPTFDWTSTSLVAAIFVKGGPDGNLYDYRPDGALADTGLHAPVNDSNGKYYGLSHLTFE
jgi:hypothetical protein